MRVSTQQFYFENSLNMSLKSSDINEQTPYISSGKRVLTAKDDAVSFATLTGYKDELSRIKQYQRNIVQAKNSNVLIETSFDLTQDALLQVKELFIQANNSALNDADRTSLAEQAKQNLEQILDIANSQDETGGFIFSGYQIEKQPFVLQPDNSVIYQGDNGINRLQIANNVSVEINQPGDSAFMKVNNALGDFSPNYQINNGGATVSKAIIANRGNYDTSAFPPGYTFDFTDADSNGSLEVVITDVTSTAVTTIDPFVPGQPFSFNGVEVTIEGTPNIGDKISIVPDQEVSVFETLKAAIDWLNLDTNVANSSQRDIDYGHILSQLNTAMNYISSRQGEAGINLKLIDNKSNDHEESKLYLEQGRSSIEDLDYASAISRFEQSKVALQAAQQTFSQIQGLSLFNYI